MKFKILLLILTATTLSYSSEKFVEIRISDNISISLYKSEFDTTLHNIERCIILDWFGICKIDGKQVYGTDWEMPKSKLDSAFVQIDNIKIPLEVSCMYNPWFGEINKELFSLQKCEGGFIIKGTFSDGAGSYSVEWRIIKNTSLRISIFDDGC